MAPKRAPSVLSDDQLQAGIDDYVAAHTAGEAHGGALFDVGAFYATAQFAHQPDMAGLLHLEPLLTPLLKRAPSAIINQRALAQRLLQTFLGLQHAPANACPALAESVAGSVQCGLAHLRKLCQVPRALEQRSRHASPEALAAFRKMAELFVFADGDAFAAPESWSDRPAEAAGTAADAAEAHGCATRPPQRSQTLGRVPSCESLPPESDSQREQPDSLESETSECASSHLPSSSSSSAGPAASRSVSRSSERRKRPRTLGRVPSGSLSPPRADALALLSLSAWPAHVVETAVAVAAPPCFAALPDAPSCVVSAL